MQILLDRGADIETRNDRGATPLITASAHGNLALVTLLLAQGARIDAVDRDGNTALHEASFQSHPSCVDALLAAGAPTTTRNNFGFLPLHQAVRRFWETAGESRKDRLARQAQVISRLLRHGADPDMHDDAGRTPAALADENNNASLRQVFRPLSAPIPPTLSPTTKRPSVDPTPSRQAITPEQNHAAPPANDPPGDQVGERATRAEPPRPDAHPTVPSSPPPANDKRERETTSDAPALLPPSPTSAQSPPDTIATPLRETVATSPASIAPDQETPAASSPMVTPPIPAPSAQRPVDSPASTAGSSTATLQAEDMAIIAPKSTAPASLLSEQSWKPARLQSSATPPSPPDPAHGQQAALPTLTEERRSHVPAIPPREQKAPQTTQAEMATLEASEPTRPALVPSTVTQAKTELPIPEPPSAPATSRPAHTGTEEPESAAAHAPWITQSLGFGLGLGWTHNLGARRVESVSVVNRIVRIDEERNDSVRVMPEVHLWIDRWDEQRWSWGPFLAVAPGSRIVDAVGGGLMLGYRPHRTNQYSFNFGIGGTLDLDARVLGDGLIANEPLPPRESSARTKHTTAAGLLILFSVGWDLSAARQNQAALK